MRLWVLLFSTCSHLSSLCLCPRWERRVSSRSRQPLIALRWQSPVIYSILPQPHILNGKFQVFAAAGFHMCVRGCVSSCLRMCMSACPITDTTSGHQATLWRLNCLNLPLRKSIFYLTDINNITYCKFYSCVILESYKIYNDHTPSLSLMNRGMRGTWETQSGSGNHIAQNEYYSVSVLINEAYWFVSSLWTSFSSSISSSSLLLFSMPSLAAILHNTKASPPLRYQWWHQLSLLMLQHHKLLLQLAEKH